MGKEYTDEELKILADIHSVSTHSSRTSIASVIAVLNALRADIGSPAEVFSFWSKYEKIIKEIENDESLKAILENAKLEVNEGIEEIVQDTLEGLVHFGFVDATKDGEYWILTQRGKKAVGLLFVK